MILAILDTNVLVQSLISSARSASARTLDAHYEERFRLVYSPGTLDELITVLMVPHIRRRHGLTDDEILDFIASLLTDAERFDDPSDELLPIALTRDVTDAKFLALAQQSKADFLVSNDRRHLGRLREYEGTRIVTAAQFLRKLG